MRLPGVSYEAFRPWSTIEQALREQAFAYTEEVLGCDIRYVAPLVRSAISNSG